jgi:hypothetical protein
MTWIAQFLVLPSLLLTVIFSYLALREARLSRDMQEDLFIGQNAPVVEIVGVRLSPSGRGLTLTLENTGDSKGQLECLTLHNVMLQSWSAGCPDRYPFAGLNLRKKQRFDHPINFGLEGAPIVGFRPNKAMLTVAGQEIARCEGSRKEAFVITTLFKDVLKNRHLNTSLLTVCG